MCSSCSRLIVVDFWKKGIYRLEALCAQSTNELAARKSLSWVYNNFGSLPGVDDDSWHLSFVSSFEQLVDEIPFERVEEASQTRINVETGPEGAITAMECFLILRTLQGDPWATKPTRPNQI